MRRLFLFVVATLLMVVLPVSGKQREGVVMKVDAFSAINVVGKIHVVYEQGSGYEVRLAGDAADCIDVKMENSSLNLCPKTNVNKVGGVYYESVDWTVGATVYVKAPSVRSFSLAGSGSISVDRMSGKRAAFNVAGSGTASVNHLSVDEASFNVAGSGQMKAADVKAGKAMLSVAGSGSVSANLAQASELSCSVAGSGNITVSGKTVKYSKSIYGGGTITDSSLKYESVSNSSVGYGGDDRIYYNVDSQRNDNGILADP